VSRNGEGRDWSAADKLPIVLARMQPGVDVFDLWRREGLNSVLNHAWKKQLLRLASRIFEERQVKPRTHEQRREAELVRFNGVIAGLRGENLEPKKGLPG
jgi:transposase-like protein